jgi:hypothetical protein
LLAWVNCFRDCPPTAPYDAGRSRDIALQHLQDLQLEDATRASLLQSLYKANNTLGQIYLIQARSLVTEGHRYLRNNSIDLADVCFHLARPLFDSARQWFSEARKLLTEHFPSELTSIDFHIAEVTYYDRNPVWEYEKQNAVDFNTSQLRAAQFKFKQVLSLAYQRTPYPHQRLIAHCQYYLGKIARRLNNDVEAWERLIVAEEIAIKYSDDVLLARIHFAQSQWHEAMRIRRSQSWLKNIHFEEAKNLLAVSIASFQRLNMKIELIDAISFGNRLPSEPAPI